MLSEDLRIIAEELSPKQFIVFAGSGVATSNGIPSWQNLIEKLLIDNPIKLSYDIKNISQAEYPDVAQKIYDSYLSAGQEEKYFEILKSVLQPTVSRHSTQEFQIVTTTTWVVTTNFEPSFISAFKKKYSVQKELNKVCISSSLPTFSDINRLTSEGIDFLHGNLDEKYIVFTKTFYNNYYPSTSGDGAMTLENHIKYLFQHYHLVFIGFSFEEHVFNCLKAIWNQIKKDDEINGAKKGYIPTQNSIQHYAFLKKPVKDYLKYIDSSQTPLEPIDNKTKNKINWFIDIKNKLQEMKIKVYEMDEYIDWVDCFDIINDLRQIKQTESISFNDASDGTN